MKRRLYSPCILGFMAFLAGAFFLGCKPKELSDVYPVVELKDISFNAANGSMTLKGEVISKGNYDIVEVGFYTSTPDEASGFWNMHRSVLNGNEFTTTFYIYGYPWESVLLDDGIEIFGKAYAVNELGFSLSEVKKSEPCYVAEVDTPCDLELNTIQHGTNLSTLNIENDFYGSDLSYITVLNNADNLNNFTIRFNRMATQGIYMTAEEPDNGNTQEVYIEFIGKKMAAGSFLYVEHLGSDSLDISLCDGTLLPDNVPGVFRFHARRW
ncbi:MAG: hypothetical protein ACKVOK_03930 [Flavobacteriales bacterium]